MIIEIQCLASPAGNETNRYAHIDAAIDVARQSGLKFEVGALGTTFEGDADACWALARRMHEACLAAGANGLVSVVKVEQRRDSTGEPTIESLTAKHRA